MEKFCLHVSGTVQGDVSNLDDLRLEGSGEILMASLSYAICEISKAISITEDEILGDLGRIIRRSK